MAASIAEALGAVADLVMPRGCICCGRNLLPSERHICVCCRADLPRTHFATIRCNPMSESFNSLISREMDSAPAYQPYSYASALFYYRGGYRQISKSLKYHRNFAAGKYFSHLLGEALSRSSLFADVDLVVPIPLHWTRRWKRGYNQAEVIAREVSGCLGAALGAGILRRSRRTRTQTTLGPQGRAANTRGAFSVRRAFPCRHILLVDDVYTTGATALACERALRPAFPEARISIATLAFVEH